MNRSIAWIIDKRTSQGLPRQIPAPVDGLKKHFSVEIIEGYDGLFKDLQIRGTVLALVPYGEYPSWNSSPSLAVVSYVYGELPPEVLGLDVGRIILDFRELSESEAHTLVLSIIERTLWVDTASVHSIQRKLKGVGAAAPFPQHEAESLIEAFQERFFEAKLEIRKFEKQIEDFERQGASVDFVDTLRLKMEALANREKAWIAKLSKSVEGYKVLKKKPKK